MDEFGAVNAVNGAVPTAPAAIANTAVCCCCCCCCFCHGCSCSSYSVCCWHPTSESLVLTVFAKHASVSFPPIVCFPPPMQCHIWYIQTLPEYKAKYGDPKLSEVDFMAWAKKRGERWADKRAKSATSNMYVMYLSLLIYSLQLNFFCKPCT